MIKEPKKKIACPIQYCTYIAEGESTMFEHLVTYHAPEVIAEKLAEILDKGRL